MATSKKSNQGSDKYSGNKSGYISDSIQGSVRPERIEGDVKPARYEKPETRPAPSPKPPKKKEG